MFEEGSEERAKGREMVVMGVFSVSVTLEGVKGVLALGPTPRLGAGTAAMYIRCTVRVNRVSVARNTSFGCLQSSCEVLPLKYPVLRTAPLLRRRLHPPTPFRLRSWGKRSLPPPRLALRLLL